MHLIAVPERVLTQGVFAFLGQLGLGGQDLRQVLREGMGDVDAEAVHATVGPEAEGLQEVFTNLGVVPVEVRLLLGEDVHVPLSRGAVRFGDALPGRAAENRVPVRRGQLAVLAQAVAEDVAFTGSRTLR
ncbi:hypothetical protein AHiyo8_49880 [Arthrobacter sp. Hiyo8]|nr:hypothetical protein AHiyo8_49880 [Arthrobacter sp. Hiyo8]